MSDTEERKEDYKKELIDSGHVKHTDIRHKHLKGKQYCDKCKHFQPFDTENIQDRLNLARCGKKLNNRSNLRISKEIKPAYMFCANVRTGDRCEYFEPADTILT